MKAINRYPYGMPKGIRFIEVTGEDGVSFDLVNAFDAKKHIKALKDGGYETKVVSRRVIPSCILRDFTDGLDSYTDVIYQGKIKLGGKIS